MAEIINVDFLNKKIISREQTDPKIGPGEQTDTPSNFIFGREMGQYLVDSMPDMNLLYLRTIPCEVNEFDLCLDQLAEFTDKELIDTFADASEVSWQERPAYYRALDQEIQNRIKAKKF